MGSFMMECFDPFHVASMERRGTMVRISCIVCGFVFIVTRRATSQIIVASCFR